MPRDSFGPVNCVITVATDDDLSAAISVPNGAGSALVLVPTITSATVSAQVSNDGGTTYATLYNVDETVQGFPTASTGGRYMPLIFFGKVTHMKIATGAGQAADRTFKVSFLI